MRVQAAWLGNNPQGYAARPVVNRVSILLPELRVRLPERRAVRGNSGDGNGAWIQVANPSHQVGSALAQFIAAQFTCACSGPADQVRDADSA